MANFLNSAMAHSAAALKGNRGDSVTYQRGAESVSITAAMGSTEFERDDGDGVQVAFKSTDFIITASEIILGGFATQPRRGDKIVSGTRTYEVLSINGEPHFSWMDAAGTLMRIHTKLIRDE